MKATYYVFRIEGKGWGEETYGKEFTNKAEAVNTAKALRAESAEGAKIGVQWASGANERTQSGIWWY
jgi:hypothetical protein